MERPERIPDPEREAQAAQSDRHRRHPKPHAVHGPRFLSLSKRLTIVVGLVSVAGIAAGIAGIVFTWNDASIPEHAPQELQDVWAKMRAACEKRLGRSSIEVTEMRLIEPHE